MKINLVRTAQLVKGIKQIAVDETSEDDRQVNLHGYRTEIIASLNSFPQQGKS